jgi:HlyD family secretion protein/macrolide-specific efflux system membrane fusion protein
MARSKRNLLRWISLAGLLVIGAVAGGLELEKRKDPQAQELESSLVVTAKRADLVLEVIETGKVEPRERVEVKSKVPGQVARVFVDAGDKVRKGQLLLRLDPTDYDREVAKCEAELKSARNALGFAHLMLERRQRGVEARAVAQVDLETAQSEVTAKEAALQLASVACHAARDRLRYTQIGSPIDGTVTERGVEAGEVVTPGVQATFEGRPLVTIANLSVLIVKADLNQIDVARVKLGQTVSLTLDALPGKRYEATVTRIAPASVTQKGKDVEVFPTEATLAHADGAIKPGMTAEVRVHIETRQDVLTLPIEAVVKEENKQYVNKLVVAGANKKSERVAVEVGGHNDREIEIVSGLSAGDKVLIKPASAADNELKL